MSGKGHFTVDPSLHAEAMGCFIANLVAIADESDVAEALDALDEADARFFPIVTVALETALKEAGIEVEPMG